MFQMKPGRYKSATAVAFVAAVALTLSGCGAGASESQNATAGADANASPSVLPPVLVQIDEIDGTSVEVARTNVVVLLSPESEDASDWKASFSDATIAKFTPAKKDKNTSFNAGIEPLAKGSTEVTIDRGDEGTVTFTLNVIVAE